MYTCVVGVTKMGDIVPRVGIEPTSLAFQASVLPLHHIGSLMSPLFPRPHAHLCRRSQCRLLHSSPWNCKSFNAFNYIYSSNDIHLHTQGRFNNHTEYSLYRIMVMTTSVVGLMKMGNIVPRAGTEPTSGIVGQCATIAPYMLLDVSTVPTPTCLCSSLPQRAVQTTRILHSGNYKFSKSFHLTRPGIETHNLRHRK